MTHFLIAVFIEQDELSDYQAEVARLLEPYREVWIDELEDFAPGAKWDYWRVIASNEYVADTMEDVRGIIVGECAAFGIVAPEIGWWDRYDEMGADEIRSGLVASV